MIYFARLNAKGVSEKSIESDILVGEVAGSALENFKAIVSELFFPIVQEQQQWGKAKDANAKEFISDTGKLSTMLSEAVQTVSGGVELSKPASSTVNKYEAKPSAYATAAADEASAREVEQCLTAWCIEAERLLAQKNVIKDGEEPGPDTELEYWRARMANLFSITEQLKGKECKFVLAVAAAGKTNAFNRWRPIDMQITEAANEAKDNVKYLATLEKGLAPLYTGTVQEVTETVPSLMNLVKVMMMEWNTCVHMHCCSGHNQALGYMHTHACMHAVHAWKIACMRGRPCE